VSEAILPLVQQAGFTWMATDEEILARSLGRGLGRDEQGRSMAPDLLYRAYRVSGGGQGAGGLSCGFRDHALSDLIGFTYSSWPADAAADDFIRRLEEAGRSFTDRTGGDATIFVILDGENAWEYYVDQGRPFLRALYARLSSHPDLQTVTMHEACTSPTGRLSGLFPGSWINGDFYVWIGHADDHLAWSQLGDARRALESAEHVTPAARARAHEELLIAEGSDWFWWYGDDHSSDHDPEFDDLFRRHVRNVYGSLGMPVPEELFTSNISTRPVTVHIEEPSGVVTPVLDGEPTSYFEWLGAGRYEAETLVGAMHQVAERAPAVSSLLFGADTDALALRVDATVPVSDVLGAGLSVVVTFLTPAGIRIVVGDVSAGVRLERRGGDAAWVVMPAPGLAVAAGRILEVRVPRALLGVEAVAFIVALTRGDVELEHHPRHRPVEVMFGNGRNRKAWTV
jgi:hypothetical protein